MPRPFAETKDSKPIPRLDLTDRFIQGAKAKGAPQVDYFDEGTPGLALRVSQGGKKAWSFIFTASTGKRARLTLGTYPGTSLAKARTLALEARAEANSGRDPRDLFAAQEANAATVAMLAESYLEKHIRPNLRSAANFEQRINRNVLPVIGSVRLADLHPRDLNRVLDPIIARGAPSEANRVYENLRAMFRWAVRRGDLDKSPTDRMAKPAPESAPRERFLSDDEIRHLWHILPSALAQSKTCQRIVKLCLITGQRCGEVAGMRRDELDLKKAVWSLPGSRTKNASPHVVPLSDMALSIIKEALDAAGDDAAFVFPSPVTDAEREITGIDPHAVATTLRRAHQVTKARPQGRFEMAAWTSHDLRRSALTGLAKLGVAPIVIGAVANHLSVTKAGVTFTAYVQHDYAKEKRDALDLWADRLKGIINGAEVVPLTVRKK